MPAPAARGVPVPWSLRIPGGSRSASPSGCQHRIASCAMKRPIKVLIVDDSAVVRQTLPEVLSSDPDIAVLGTASDPFAAARRIQAEVPDVITLDVEMPRMDGITFLRKLMAQLPIPVVTCSSLAEKGSETLMQALEAGAVDVILKPRLGTAQFLKESKLRICEAVKDAAQARLHKR